MDPAWWSEGLRADVTLTQLFGLLLWEKCSWYCRLGFYQCYAKNMKQTNKNYTFKAELSHWWKVWWAMCCMHWMTCLVDSTSELELQVWLVIIYFYFLQKRKGNTSHTGSLPSAALICHALQQAWRCRGSSFCSLPLSSARGWDPKSSRVAVAAQLAQCCSWAAKGALRAMPLASGMNPL